MSLSTFVKSLQNIMRNDEGINGDAQRIEQIVWLLFLKIYDAKEEEWEFMDSAYRSIIPEKLRWRSWAVDKKDGKALTGDALLNFVNNELFPGLRDLPLDETSSRRQRIVRAAFEDNNNFMKKGVLLRQVINVIDAIDVSSLNSRHAFGEIYETILKSLQSAGNAGEFYTPRAVTDFMAAMLAPNSPALPALWPSTRPAAAPGIPSSRSTAPPSRKTCWKASCSVRSRAPTPTPRTSPACSKRPTAAPCSSTSSTPCP